MSEDAIGFLGGKYFRWSDSLYTRGIFGDNLGKNNVGKVLPGWNGKAIAGHGVFNFGDGTVTIPKGTTLIAPRANIKTHDQTGRLLESLDVNAFERGGKIANSKLLHQKIQNDVPVRLRNRVHRDLEGLRILKPGDEIENLTFSQPDKQLTIFENSTTVIDNSVKLNDIMKEDLGTCIVATFSIHMR